MCWGMTPHLPQPRVKKLRCRNLKHVEQTLLNSPGSHNNQNSLACVSASVCVCVAWCITLGAHIMNGTSGSTLGCQHGESRAVAGHCSRSERQLGTLLVSKPLGMPCCNTLVGIVGFGSLYRPRLMPAETTRQPAVRANIGVTWAATCNLLACHSGSETSLSESGADGGGC